MTRCKPGDLAYIVGNSPQCLSVTDGVVVRVLHLVGIGADGYVKFPDGTYGEATGRNTWVIEFVAPMPILKRSGRISNARYATCADRHLRPITPPANTVTDKEVRELYDPRELVLVTRERA